MHKLRLFSILAALVFLFAMTTSVSAGANCSKSGKTCSAEKAKQCGKMDAKACAEKCQKDAKDCSMHESKHAQCQQQCAEMKKSCDKKDSCDKTSYRDKLKKGYNGGKCCCPEKC